MAQKICPNCGYVGKPKTITKGSIIIEILAWFLAIIPGVIYSLWRLSSKQKVCPKCGNPNMIPLNSPRGQQLVKELNIQLPTTPTTPQEYKGVSTKTIIWIFVAVFLLAPIPFVLLFSLIPNSHAKVAYCVADSTYLMKKPTVKSDTLRIIRKGALVNVKKEKDKWTYVSLHGINKNWKGWIKSTTIVPESTWFAMKNKKLKSKQAKLIKYTVLSRSVPTGGGIRMDILVSPKAKKSQVMALARYLHDKYKSENFVWILIYDSREAWRNRENENYPTSKYFKHFLAKAAHNSYTGYDEVAWMAQGRGY